MATLVRLLLMVCALLWAAASASAQPMTPAPQTPPGETTPASPAAEGPAVRELKPETYLLPNKDGTLLPVLNLPFEELDRLMQLDIRSGASVPAPPAFSLQELTITGSADAEQAELTVSVKVRLQREGWAKVPLRFVGAILREPATCDGAGEFFLLHENEAGYTAWLRSSPDKLRVASLKLVVPLQPLGNETRLTLPVPRATSSQLDLRVPQVNAAATVTSGLLEVRKGEKDTQFRVAGVAGDFRIAWRRGEPKPANDKPMLDVRYDTVVKVESPRQVTADMRLKVTSLRGEFEAFVVRLPQGVRLLPRQFGRTDMQVTEADSPDPAVSKLVQVKLDRRTAGSVELQLMTEMTAGANGRTPGEFEIGGVEVVDASRQTGAIDIVSKGDWSVTWRWGNNVQRTVVPEASKARIAARFEFGQCPFSLKMQVAQKETQTSVEPVYVLHVSAGAVRLDATLKYRLRSARADSVSIDLAGWRVTAIVPEALVVQAALDLEQVKPLQVPLMPLTETEGREFTLRLDAQQAIAPNTGYLTLVLPRPDAASAMPATIAVVPDDNVELTLDEPASKGLERLMQAPKLDLPPRQQKPLFLRERGDALSAVFAAALRVRPRAVSVQVAHAVALDSRRMRVTTQLRYGVHYEPLRRVVLDVPRAIFQAGGLRALCADEALPLTVAADARDGAKAAGAKATDRILVEADLLRERIGEFELRVQYVQAVRSLPPADETSVPVPLILPAAAPDTTIAQAELQLALEPGVQARLDDPGGAWETRVPVAEAAPVPDQGVTFVSSETPAAVTLRLSQAEPQQRGAILVSRAWLQTWHERWKCRERAVFRVATEDDRLAIRLPEDATFEDLALDGRRIVSADNSQPQTVVVDLPDESPPAEHVVELWYARSDEALAGGYVALEPPVVVDALPWRRWYWQVAVPNDLMLLQFPAELTPELTWRWQGFGWRRQSSLDQAGLERWSGASPQQPLPDAVHRYLFSSFGEMPLVYVRVVPWPTVLMLCSGIVLAVGLLVIYVRVLRHPAALFAGGVLVLAGVVAAPDLSLAVVQAAALGVALSATAAVLKSAVDARQRRRTVVRGSIASGPETRTARAAVVPSHGSSRVATTIAPAPAQLPVAEPRP